MRSTACAAADVAARRRGGRTAGAAGGGGRLISLGGGPTWARRRRPGDLRAGLTSRCAKPAIALRGYINLCDVLQLLGRHAEAEVAVEGLVLAARVGRARTLGSFLAGNMAMSVLQRGHWPETERLTAEASARPQGIYRASSCSRRLTGPRVAATTWPPQTCPRPAGASSR